MRSWLKKILFSLLALVLIIPIALWSVLSTQSGSRWVLSMVPGLTVEQFEGALLDSWKASYLSWQQDELKVEIDQLDFQWRASCLWDKQVCIDVLTANKVNLNLPANAEPNEPSTAPVVLPELELPIAIFLKQLAVNDFSLNGESLLQGLAANLSWTSEGYAIHNLTLALNDIKAKAQGTVNPVGAWETLLQLEAVLPISETDSIQVSAHTQGNLSQLQVDANTSGFINTQANIHLEPLTPDLPLMAKLKVQQFLADPELPPSLLLEELNLSATGDLAKGFKVLGHGQLKGDKHPVLLQLLADIGLEGATVEHLNLIQEQQGLLGIQGKASWQQLLTADLSLDWRQFNWLELYPMDEPPVTVDSFKAAIQLRDKIYQGGFSGELKGPAGEYSLSSELSGSFEQVQLSKLTIKAGKGQLDGTLHLGFAKAIDWLAEIKISQLDPAFWVEELPGTLDGHIHSKGKLEGEHLALTTDVAVKGNLRRSNTSLTIKAQGTESHLNLKQLSFFLGENRLEATAQLHNKTLTADSKLEFTRLAQLWPGLSGRLDGVAKATGSLEQPIINGDFKIKKLSYQDQHIETLSLIANLDKHQKVMANLDVQGIVSGDQDFGRLQLELKGSEQQHQLTTTLNGADLQLALKLDGKLDTKGNWQGRLGSLSINSSGQNWALANPLQIDYLASGVLTLEAHCLVSGQASFCAKKQKILPDLDIDYSLKNFTLASLQPLLPKGFKLTGAVNGRIHLQLPDSGPSGVIFLDASNGQLDLMVDNKATRFKWGTLRLDSNLTPNKVTAAVVFKGPNNSQLELNAQINPLAKDKPINGFFTIENVDLALIKPFVDEVDKLQGSLQGKGSISGGLEAPLVTGNVSLKNVYIAGGELPVSFEPLNLQAKLLGNYLTLEGQWKSGKKGQGAISGNIAWQNDLNLAILVKSDKLPIVVEPYANLEVATDLKISMEHQQLKVDGKVQVPKGAIDVPQLPPSAVQLSSDAQIVGVEVEESDFRLAMNVLVEVGSDKLTFTGFGLKANILGHMQITDNMGGRGTLELKNGRYNAFGQKLELRQAQLIFAGPLSEPFLNIEAVRVTGDVTAGLRLTGSALQPQSEVFSRPAMSQEQALSWLLMGRPLDGGGDGNAMAQAALALGLMGTSPLASKLADKVGVREFTLDTEGDGDETSVVASGRITDKMTLRYGVGVFDPSTILSLRYELTKRLYVEAASGISNSIDFFYKRSF
ncbi:translocation/assembly module TamB domain-containing protein [Pseudomonas sp. F1_0610]|uniref:translocation/assembly module TamB domain-containing protein n=1 Tax=Pseudomonas sp. F1_0610 TaxID=3114284 RepID=UPI0039C22992